MAQKPKTYRFSKFRAEAEKKRAKETPRTEVPPFVIDDVTPPIVITQPDTLERQIVIGDFVASGNAGNWNGQNAMPLLQALCGDQFGRVWMLVKDDPDAHAMIALIEAMFEHFASVLEDVNGAAELPGGSGDSSN